MSYPHAIATGNSVIVAAVAYLLASEAVDTLPIGERYDELWITTQALGELRRVTRIHLETIAVEHTQHPDPDA